MSAEVTAVLDRAPSLAGRPRQVEELPGGLTNRNYKVTTPAGVFVARRWSPGTSALEIDRDHEYRNSVAAAAAGVGAPVIDYRPADQLLVLGFLDGSTLTSADVASPGTLARIGAACRQLHRGSRFASDFDMFEIQRRYLATATARGIKLPRGYDRAAGTFEDLRRALAVRAGPTVPCHNDLLAANFIDDGARIWMIDYEYSGNNDPCFELGNLAAECGLSADQLAGLVRAYYGRALRGKIARARLLGLAGRYAWTLWGAIQAATSPLDFDFWSWAMERYEAALAGFADPGFPALLREAQHAG